MCVLIRQIYFNGLFFRTRNLAKKLRFEYRKGKMEKGRDVNDGSLDKVKQRRHRNGFDHLKCFQDFSSEVKIKKYKY